MFIPGGSAIETGGYNINNSLRFRSSASAYLSRTFSTPTAQNKWTYSTWVKPSLYYSGTYGLFGLNSASDNNGMGFDGSNNSQFIWFGSGVNFIKTTQVFRDPSAWYHIVLAVDSAASGTNKIRFYVNGSEVTSFSSDGRAAFSSSNVNTASVHAIGRRQWDGTQYYDGYETEINFVDGQQLTPSSFGATDAITGVWAPAAYTGTYGTNGFYLKFSDIATTSGSNAGLGKDFSGNTNYWTTNNISVTAGTTYDAMTDSPTLTSATVANYPVLNPLRTYTASLTLSNANLTATDTSVNTTTRVASMSFPTSGKYYFEVTVTTITSSNGFIGVAPNSVVIDNSAFSTIGSYRSDGSIRNLSGTTQTTGSSYTSGDIISVAIDVTNGNVQFYKNNVSQGATPSFTFTAGTELWAFVATDNAAGTKTYSINFGQRPFSYTPPTGYVALNTYNLPTPTILQGNKYMDATLYAGTGATLSVTNAGTFKPDLVWIKRRNSTGNNVLVDSVRGASLQLASSDTAAEITAATGVTSFNSNGWSLGSGSTGYATNDSGFNYVGWQWQAGQGSTSSNTAGSITSTTSVSTTAGFSVVTYTGNGVNGATVGHGLGVSPSMVVVKKRSTGTAGNWITYHVGIGASRYLSLNTTDAQSALNNTWGISSTTIALNQPYNDYNTSTAPYVAYCWAEIAGFSRFGSYIGNGSTDGTFVYTGFRPKWVLIKNISAVGSWFLFDTARLGYNSTNNYLLSNASTAETTYNGVDILSNGFKLRNTDSGLNDNGVSYIYAAFAENPFKNALAR